MRVKIPNVKSPALAKATAGRQMSNQQTFRIGLASLQSGAGFTLIEIIVVFSILSVLSAVGLASFVTYSRTQAVTNERNNLILTLNVAKARAQSQVKPSNCDTQTLNGYQVSINTINNTYSLIADCSTADAVISTTRLSSNITFQSTSETTYSFPVLTGGVTGGTIVITGYGIVQTINVNTNGTIN